MRDQGSQPQFARVVVAGVPLDYVVDTGADITIVAAEAFKCITESHQFPLPGSD